MAGRQSQIGSRLLIGWLLPVAGVGALRVDALYGQSLPTGQTAPDARQSPPADSFVSPELLGKKVEEVRVTGNSQVSSQEVLNLVRTHIGDKFDQATVEEDYQRIFTLKRFSNVEGRVEPTTTGVIVVFEVTEEKLIHSVIFSGNKSVDSDELRRAVAIKTGEAIEQFRISLAKRAIVNLYKTKNYPSAHVEVDNAELTRTGNLTFHVVEAQPVTIRNIEFIGAKSYTTGFFGKLIDQVKSRRSLWIFNSGTYDPEQVDEDVASLRHFYQSEGFFNVAVGRKLIFSPDQTELQINFLIDEGVRFKVDKISFVGNKNVPEFVLRKNLHLVEGRYFDNELLQRDVKEVVRAYSPLGYVYDPSSPDPNYLRVGKPQYPWVAHVVYHDEPGTVELVYEISEGKPFRVGRIIVKGNDATQQKVVLRELHVSPGDKYNSGELEDAVDRLHGVASFSPQSGDPNTVSITPIGNAPDTRDVLVEVKEQKTAIIQFGGSVNSNLGLAGNATFEQRNFDITNVPTRFDDFLNDRAFTGAGQDLSISFSPGLDQTSASVRFTEPYLLDLPYSNSDEAHFQQTQREYWTETRGGGSFTFGKQINYDWSAALTLAAEDVKIGTIDDYYPVTKRVDVIDPVTHEPRIGGSGQVLTHIRSRRAPDVLIHAGHNTVTDIGLALRRDTTNHGPLTYRGSNLRFSYELFGALGGQYHYHQFGATFDGYQTLYTDLLDRRTVFNVHLDAGYILNDAPFFNRFYGGGQGSMRGFEYRGVGPRAGRDLDPIGGNLNLVGSIGLNYPIFGDNIRGVVFTDFGTVEPGIRIHTIRDSVGAGVRVTIPQLGFSRPLAFDIAFPVLKGNNDIKSIFSFGVGI